MGLRETDLGREVVVHVRVKVEMVLAEAREGDGVKEQGEGAALRERCQGYRYALLVGEPALAQALALPGARRSIVVLGGTERLLLVGAL